MLWAIMINRRQYLVASTLAVTGVAGCTGSGSGPDPVVSNTQNVEPRNIDVQNQGNEFIAEIQNSGISGTVIVELFFTENGEPSASPAAETNTYIESGDTREISFEREPPQWADGYEFQYQGTVYAADVRNDGGEGDLELELIDQPSGTVIQEKTIRISADETRTVEFETTHEFDEEYEIVAESV